MLERSVWKRRVVDRSIVPSAFNDDGIELGNIDRIYRLLLHTTLGDLIQLDSHIDRRSLMGPQANPLGHHPTLNPARG